MKGHPKLEDIELLSENALEVSLAGYWDLDMLSNDEYLSPRFKEMFGYLDHEMENKPESWQRIIFKEDLPVVLDDFNKHIESKGEIPFRSVIRYHHKNGRTIWVKCNGKIVEWAKDGSPIRAVGCHIDITEEKELENKLKKVIAEKDVLLSEVHHRVKNNLQLIQSLARLKQKDNKLDLNEIEDSISAISSAHEALYKTDRFDKIDLKKYLLRVIQPILEVQKIQFEINSDVIEKEIDFLIQIGLIVTECVNNSIKHGFSASTTNKKVSIYIKRFDHQVSITYNDNGQGYPYYLLKGNSKLNSSGLVLMDSMAQQINGKIDLTNNHGAQMKLLIHSSINVG
ncbi:MAG: PAS domain-containing protein [Vicingaceae bacterium]|jgi:PAS domain S-box-containing protein